MHELSMMSALVEQVEALALKEQFEKVREIRLSVGTLSGVDPSCLEFCFSEASEDSVLNGAKLIIEPVEIELVCRACGETSYPEDPSQLICSKCQSNQIHIRKGREFKIKEIEVD